MDYEDAIIFRGQYFPIAERGDGTQDPKTYKCIELKPDSELSLALPEFNYVSPVDGKKFSSQSELDSYIKSNFDHMERATDPALDQEISKKRKP